MAFTGRTSRDQNQVGLIQPGCDSPGPGSYDSGQSGSRYRRIVPSSAPFGGTSQRPILGAPTAFIGASSRSRPESEGFSQTPGPSRAHEPIRIRTNAALESAFLSEAPRFGIGGAMGTQHPSHVTPGPGAYKLPGAIRIHDRGHERSPRSQHTAGRPKTSVGVLKGRAGQGSEGRSRGGPSSSVPTRGHRGFRELADGTLQQLQPRADPHGGSGPGPGMYDPVGAMHRMHRAKASTRLSGAAAGSTPGGATFGADRGARTDFSTAGLDKQLVGGGGGGGAGIGDGSVPAGVGPHLSKYGSMPNRRKRRIFVPQKRPDSVFASGTRRGGALEVPRNMQVVPGPGEHYNAHTEAFNGMARAQRHQSYPGPASSPMQADGKESAAMFAPPRSPKPGFGGRSERAPLSRNTGTPGPGQYDLPGSPIKASRGGSPVGGFGGQLASFPPSMESAAVAAQMAALHANDRGQPGTLSGSYQPAAGGGGQMLRAVLPRRYAPFGTSQRRSGMGSGAGSSPDPTAYNLPTMAGDMVKKAAFKGVLRPPPFGSSGARFGPLSAIPDVPREEQDGPFDDGRAWPASSAHISGLHGGASVYDTDSIGGTLGQARAQLGHRSRPVRRSKSPAPGQYDPHVHPSEMTEALMQAPNAAFRSGTDRFDDMVARQLMSGGKDSVGPGQYGVPGLPGDVGRSNRGGMMNSGPRDRFHGGPMDTGAGRSKGVKQPSVGQYNIKSGFERAAAGTRAKSQLGGTGSRFKDPAMSQNSRSGSRVPGPGQYLPQMAWLTKSYNITVVNEEARQRVRESRLLSAQARLKGAPGRGSRRVQTAAARGNRGLVRGNLTVGGESPMY